MEHHPMVPQSGACVVAVAQYGAASPGTALSAPRQSLSGAAMPDGAICGVAHA